MQAPKYKTPKQQQIDIKKRHLISFRRWLSLEGNGDAIRDFVDLNAFELREYIESLWLEGMNWENYRSFWVIDHIVALKYFNALDIKEMKLCWNHYNLHPTYTSDNHAKGYNPETSKKLLLSMPQTPSVKMLIEKVDTVVDIFEPYYNRG